MIVCLRRFPAPVLLALGLALAGCLPPPAGTGDEAKEPYYRRGEELRTSQDLAGAIEAFEKALEVNPHHSLAHFQLGLLYEKDDPATAMYHYNRFLKRSRDPVTSERARERLNACRTALAQTVALSMTPGADRLQKEVERLTLDNRELLQRIQAWEKWAADIQREPPTRGQPQAATPRVETPVAPRGVETPVVREEPIRRELTPVPPRVAATRTHRVRRGETPYSIARQYGVSLNALLAANPRLNPQRMQVDQTIVIPAR